MSAAPDDEIYVKHGGAEWTVTLWGDAAGTKIGRFRRVFSGQGSDSVRMNSRFFKLSAEEWQRIKDSPSEESIVIVGKLPLDESAVLAAGMYILAVPPQVPVAAAGAGAAGPAYRGAGRPQGPVTYQAPRPQVYIATMFFRSNGRPDTAVGVRRAALEGAVALKVGGLTQRISSEEVKVICEALSDDARTSFFKYLLEEMEFSPYYDWDRSTFTEVPNPTVKDLASAKAPFKVISTAQGVRTAAASDGRTVSDDNLSVPDVGEGGRAVVVSDAASSLDRIFRLTQTR